ncbi:MAG: hypothetical protein P4M00_19935 [Azospirillaceae bacterium]|nr:hypothetical protein [Azospirillaceae bacterium]
MADPQYPDDVTLGLLMGMTMFLDDKIGPIRCSHLMAQAPGIVLKADAYVAEPQVAHYASMLEAFGEHLIDAAQGRLRLGN